MQSGMAKRNILPVTAAPDLKIAIQKQLTQHANRERRRRAGNEDSHHCRLCVVAVRLEYVITSTRARTVFFTGRPLLPRRSECCSIRRTIAANVGAVRFYVGDRS